MRLSAEARSIGTLLLVVQADTWMERMHGIDAPGSQLGHGDCDNTRTVKLVNYVAMATTAGHTQAIMQQDEGVQQWSALSVACGLSHSCAVLEAPEPI